MDILPGDRYKLVKKFIEELKRRKYRQDTERACVLVVREFLKQQKSPKEFLASYAKQGESEVKTAHFALKLFHSFVLNEEFDEEIPSSGTHIRDKPQSVPEKTIAKTNSLDTKALQEEVLEDEPVDENSITEVAKVEEPKRPVILTKEEVSKIIELAKNPKHKIAIALLYYAGLKVSEAIGLDWNNIDYGKSLIHVDGRDVFLHQNIASLLKSCSQEDGAILSSARGRYNKRTIQLLVAGLAKKAGINKKVTPQAFRNSFAIHLLEAGADIKHVQKLLGHKNLQNTRIYAQVANSDVKNLANLL